MYVGGALIKPDSWAGASLRQEFRAANQHILNSQAWLTVQG